MNPTLERAGRLVDRYGLVLAWGVLFAFVAYAAGGLRYLAAFLLGCLLAALVLWIRRGGLRRLVQRLKRWYLTR